MIDWTKTDNDKTFQRLINHLFALECNSPGFIPSSPYIGADGGWDGFYEGFYPYENVSGKWSIQSKWTKKSFTEAVKHLKGEIKKELQKAGSNKVEHLRIVTNAELTVDQVKELESLNQDEVKTLRVWHRENLTMRIEKQPFLRHLFFGDPQFPKFVPWNTYFGKEQHLLPGSATKIPKFRHYLETAKEFILNDKKNILVISAPGGYGKSHLLREIAKISHEIDTSRQPWIVEPSYRKIEDAIQDEIASGRRYLLIFDDADRYLEEVSPILAFVKSQGMSIKVILGTRISGLSSIHRVIRDLRCEGNYMEVNISDWSKEDLIHLLQLSAEEDKVKDEELIATLYPNPFIIVWIGRKIKGKDTIDIATLKEKMINDINYEAEKCLFLNKGKITSFMLNLSCIVPFSKNDSRVIKTLSKHIGVDKDSVSRSIDQLLKSGILREVGKSLRFNPDMKGDLYLAYNLGKKVDDFTVKSLIKTWLPIFAERVLINLSAASKYGDLSVIREILADIVDTWINETDDTSGYERKERLNFLSKIAPLMPKESLNLIYAYLNSKPPLSKGLGEMTPNLDDYGPAVVELIRIPGIRRKVIELLRDLEKRNIQGTYYNYTPKALMRECISPLHNRRDLIKETLDILSTWLENALSSFEIGLISEAISEMLAGTHENTRFVMGRMEFGEMASLDVPEVHKLRDNALNLLKQMLEHPSPEVKLAGIQIAEDIGRRWGGKNPEKKLPLAHRIAKDREEIVEVIGNLISAEGDFKILNGIETLFLRWWAQEVPGTDRVADYLRDFPRSPEYIACRLFVSSDSVIENFEEIENQAPKKDKWKWFIDKFMHKIFYLKPEDLQPLVENLNGKYSGCHQILKFLGSMNEKISPSNLNPPLVTCWAKLNPDTFLSIRRDDKLWEQVPERFKKEIEVVVSEFDKGHIKKVAEDILSKLPDCPLSQLEIFLTLMRNNSVPEDDVSSWLQELLEKGNSELRSLVVGHLCPLFPKLKNYELLFNLLDTAISHEETLSPDMVQNLFVVLYNAPKYIVSVNDKTIDTFRTELYSKIRDIPKLNMDVQGLLDFVFDDIENVIEFIDYRFHKYEQILKEHKNRQDFEPLPFDGIDCIKDKVRDKGDYTKIIEKVIIWHEEDMPRRSFGLEYLMKPIASLENDRTGKPFLEEYIEEQLQHNVKKALFASRFLSFNESTLYVFKSVLQRSFDSGLTNEAKRIFVGCLDRGALTSLPGEPAPDLVRKQKLLQNLHEEVKPGKLKAFIKERIGTFGFIPKLKDLQ